MTKEKNQDNVASWRPLLFHEGLEAKLKREKQLVNLAIPRLLVTTVKTVNWIAGNKSQTGTYRSEGCNEVCACPRWKTDVIYSEEENVSSLPKKGSCFLFCFVLQAWGSWLKTVHCGWTLHSHIHPNLLSAGVHFTPSLFPWSVLGTHRPKFHSQQRRQRHLQVSESKKRVPPVNGKEALIPHLPLATLQEDNNLT